VHPFSSALLPWMGVLGCAFSVCCSPFALNRFPAVSSSASITRDQAQVAANRKGIQLVQELVAEYGLAVVQAYMHHVQANAELAVREMLKVGKGCTS
jgi:Hydantoinase B/oxoprolinase